MSLPSLRCRVTRLAFASCAWILTSAAQAGGDAAHQLRSAFIYNFAKFIEFPSDALGDGRPFVVGVDGEGSYSGDLEAALSGKTIDGHPFQIRHVHSEGEMRSCQFLVLDEVNAAEERRVVRSVQGAAVVTIGEGADFAREGGIIGFVTVEGHVRFAVNLAAARGARINISSRMLGLATQVYR